MAGNRAVVQVFEGTSGIDVKKVWIRTNISLSALHIDECLD